MASEKPRFRRFEVFHKRGKRKHIYPPERFARLQKRAKQWTAYQVEPFANIMDFCKE